MKPSIYYRYEICALKALLLWPQLVLREVIRNVFSPCHLLSTSMRTHGFSASKAMLNKVSTYYLVTNCVSAFARAKRNLDLKFK